jgi:aspartyl-tRNA synthetase
MFRALGLSDEQAKQKFGYFVEALTYGTPPHGGIAWCLDRLVMILAGTDAIRDVIAYPKTAKAQCLMSESPSVVDSHQLLELGINLLKK